jgi:hypothetical protein
MPSCATPAPAARPTFRKLHGAMGRRRQHELVVYAFDVLVGGTLGDIHEA